MNAKNILILISLLLTVPSFAATSTVPIPNIKVETLGALQQDSAIMARDGGISGLVGTQAFWTFGDTLYNNGKFITMSGGYGNISQSNTLRKAVIQDIQSQTVPFSATEQQYNDQHHDPNHRIALWPTGVIPIDREHSYLFFNAIKIKPGILNYQQLYFGISEIQSGQYVATRISDRLFSNTTISLAAQLIQNHEIYFTDCRVDGLDSPCKLAKVSIQQVTNQNDYLWWNQKIGWSKNYLQATDVFNGSTTGLSIVYNPYLKKYLTAYASFFSDGIFIRTASHIQGPWSAAQQIYTPPVTHGLVNYAVSLHPEYDQSGKTILLSYYHPSNSISGKIRLLRLDL